MLRTRITKRLAASRGFSSKIYKNRIDGQWVASSGPAQYDIIDPTNSKNVLAKVPQNILGDFQLQ